MTCGYYNHDRYRLPARAFRIPHRADVVEQLEGDGMIRVLLFLVLVLIFSISSVYACEGQYVGCGGHPWPSGGTGVVISNYHIEIIGKGGGVPSNYREINSQHWCSRQHEFYKGDIKFPCDHYIGYLNGFFPMRWVLHV